MHLPVSAKQRSGFGRDLRPGDDLADIADSGRGRAEQGRCQQEDET